jgi:hypothetical protein
VHQKVHSSTHVKDVHVHQRNRRGRFAPNELDGHQGGFLRHTQKYSVKQATSFAMLMVDQLKSQTPKYQQLVMEKFLSHPLV